MSDRDGPDGAGPAPHPLDAMFHPRGVAVVGVSTQPGPDGRMGGNFLNALLELGYDRDHALYAVNPKMSEVRGVACYPSVLDIPDPLDHVISQIPSEGVQELVGHCIQRGVRSLHFFTAGLSETGEEDLIQQERELVERARAAGLRLIGPNCMGLYAPGPGLAFNSESPKEEGNVFLLSQSGANATGIINGLGARGLRFSKGVSYGNAADLKSHDFLDYALHDPQTELVVAYIEGPRDGRAFFEAMKAVARREADDRAQGRDHPGRRARRALAHRLARRLDRRLRRALPAGRGDARAHARRPARPRRGGDHGAAPHARAQRHARRRRSGGYAVLSSDQMAMEGLAVPPLPDEVQDRLHEFIPIAGTSVRNPVDANFGRDHPMDFRSDTGLTRRAFELIAGSPTTDLIFTTVGTRWHPGQDHSRDARRRQLELTADELDRIAREYHVPIALILREANIEDAGQPAYERGVGVFPTLERAARAVATLLEWRRRREGLPELFERPEA